MLTFRVFVLHNYNIIAIDTENRRGAVRRGMACGIVRGYLSPNRRDGSVPLVIRTYILNSRDQRILVEFSNPFYGPSTFTVLLLNYL